LQNWVDLCEETKKFSEVTKQLSEVTKKFSRKLSEETKNYTCSGPVTKDVFFVTSPVQ